MNVEDALEILSNSRTPNNDWNKPHVDYYDGQYFPGQRCPTGPSTQMGFPPVSFLKKFFV